jgi:hypothetical protein
MFRVMFVDTILFMRKSRHRNDVVDQQEWVRHFRPCESIHHCFVQHRGQPFTLTFHVHDGRLTWIAMLCLNHYIVYVDSLGNCIGISCYEGHTSKSSNYSSSKFKMTSRLHGSSSQTTTHLHPHCSSYQSSETPTSSGFLFDKVFGCDSVHIFLWPVSILECVFVCHIGTCVYVCIYMEGYHYSSIYIEWKWRKVEGSTRLVYTGLGGGLEHRKIETRLRDTWRQLRNLELNCKSPHFLPVFPRTYWCMSHSDIHEQEDQLHGRTHTPMCPPILKFILKIYKTMSKGNTYIRGCRYNDRLEIKTDGSTRLEVIC